MSFLPSIIGAVQWIREVFECSILVYGEAMTGKLIIMGDFNCEWTDSNSVHSYHPDIKFEALYRLKEIGNEQALAMIRNGLHDSDPEFQEKVRQVLEELEDETESDE
jgi:hypothetical protein